MAYVTLASRYVPSASRYQSGSSVYIRGLIPRNSTECAEAVPVDGEFESHTLNRIHLRTSMKGSLNHSLIPIVNLKKIKVPGKYVILMADRKIFGNMVLVALSRYLDYDEVMF